MYHVSSVEKCEYTFILYKSAQISVGKCSRICYFWCCVWVTYMLPILSVICLAVYVTPIITGQMGCVIFAPLIVCQWLGVLMLPIVFAIQAIWAKMEALALYLCVPWEHIQVLHA